MPRPEVRWLSRYVIAQLVAQRGVLCATSLRVLDCRSCSGALVEMPLIPNRRVVTAGHRISPRERDAASARRSFDRCTLMWRTPCSLVPAPGAPSKSGSSGARIRTVFSQQPWCTSDAATVLHELPPPGRLVYRLALKAGCDARDLWGSEADCVDLDVRTGSR